ncbi:MAG: FHA domain-containing protein [Planctomycetota bacterium]
MAFLVTVSGSRISLEPGGSYVLGRGRDCDVVVEDLVCSRKHARILVPKQMSMVLLEDLGSRNGSYLNEAKIDGRAHLSHGDRVRIGTSVFLFQSEEQDTVDEIDLADTKTIAFENALFGEGREAQMFRVLKTMQGSHTNFAGQLESIGLIDLLQLLIQTQRSGTVHIALVTGRAQIEVRNGEVMAADYDGMEGFPALYALARLKSGIFWLVDTIEECVRNIEVPSRTLLVELCKALDEGARV